MKFYFKIPKNLKAAYKAELNDAKHHSARRDFPAAWSHLERAHILAQKYPFEHSLVHWKMLQFGIKMKDSKEVIGQIPRLIFGGVKSFVGKVPLGNPGGASVPPLKPFPIEAELLEIMKKAE